MCVEPLHFLMQPRQKQWSQWPIPSVMYSTVLSQSHIGLLRMPNLLSDSDALQRTTSIHIPQVLPSLLYHTMYVVALISCHKCFCILLYGKCVLHLLFMWLYTLSVMSWTPRPTHKEKGEIWCVGMSTWCIEPFLCSGSKGLRHSLLHSSQRSPWVYSQLQKHSARDGWRCLVKLHAFWPLSKWTYSHFSKRTHLHTAKKTQNS